MGPLEEGGEGLRGAPIRSARFVIRARGPMMEEVRRLLKLVGHESGAVRYREDAKRGTFLEVVNERSGRELMKAWVVDPEAGLIQVVVRDSVVADRVAQSLRIWFDEEIRDRELDVKVEIEPELEGPFREVPSVLRELARLPGVSVKRRSVRKGGRRHAMFLVVGPDGRVLVKVYVRAPRKDLTRVGGRDGAWGVETRAGGRVSAGRRSYVSMGPPGDDRFHLWLRRRRLLKRILRARPWLIRAFERLDVDEWWRTLRRLGVRARWAERLRWWVETRKVVMELLRDPDVVRALRRYRYRQTRLDDHGGGGPP